MGAYLVYLRLGWVVWGGVRVGGVLPAPDGQDADQEGQGGHDDLPGLGRTELTMVTEHLKIRNVNQVHM